MPLDVLVTLGSASTATAYCPGASRMTDASPKVESIVEEVYEAAVLPELWPGVLDKVAALSGAAGGVLFTTSGQDVRWTSSPGMASTMRAFIEEGWLTRNERARRAAALNHAGFVNDFDLFTPEEIEQDPMYEYLRGKGLGWCTGTLVPVPTGDVLVFSWERAHQRGPIAQSTVRELDPLRPHLARAGLIAARVGLERMKAAAEALAVIGLPAAVLSRSHRVLAANGLMAGLIPSVLEDRREGLRLVDRRGDALLREALIGLGRASASAPVSSIPLPASDQHLPLILHVIPVCGRAQDVLFSASCLVVVTPVSRNTVPSAEVIQGLFDLTPAEARVASGVAQGSTLQSMAAASGVSIGTVRTHLKSVFGKVGVARQAELAGLLGGGLSQPVALHPGS